MIDFPLMLQYLVVANGGLGNGVEQRELQRIFGMYGTLLDIVMQPNKPYAFVTYADIASAKAAVCEVNGQVQSLSCGEVTFYINYVKQGKQSDQQLSIINFCVWLCTNIPLLLTNAQKIVQRSNGSNRRT